MSEPNHKYDNVAPAQLRHSLRTPLNHIIGYSEMILEDLRDSVVAGQSQTAITELEAIVFNARELVRFVQNAIPGSGPVVNETEVRDLQFWLRSHVEQLIQDIVGLAAVAGPERAEDVARIRGAADRLLAFTAGDIDALSDSSTVEAVAPEINNAGSRGHILVVDDSAINRDILRRNLVRDGYAVSMAEDGESALKLLESDVFQLMLLDVVMKGMDGFEVLQRVKASPKWSGMPVIMISALDESSSVIRCMEMGAEDYFMKPFDPVLLRTRIQAALDRTSLREKFTFFCESMPAIRTALKEALDKAEAPPDLTAPKALEERLSGIALLLKSVEEFAESVHTRCFPDASTAYVNPAM